MAALEGSEAQHGGGFRTDSLQPQQASACAFGWKRCSCRALRLRRADAPDGRRRLGHQSRVPRRPQFRDLPQGKFQPLDTHTDNGPIAGDFRNWKSGAASATRHCNVAMSRHFVQATHCPVLRHARPHPPRPCRHIRDGQATHFAMCDLRGAAIHRRRWLAAADDSRRRRRADRREAYLDMLLDRILADRAVG